MAESLAGLHRLAGLMGVATRYRDGLGRDMAASPETLVRVCRAMGAPIGDVGDAEAAVRARTEVADRVLVPPVIVAWDGVIADVPVRDVRGGPIRGELTLEDGSTIVAPTDGSTVGFSDAIPAGYHRLHVDAGDRSASCTVIAAPEHSWRRADDGDGWECRPSWPRCVPSAAARSAISPTSRPCATGSVRTAATSSPCCHSSDLQRRTG